ncbi:hypothetical protein LCGC14_2923010, partial [marine sediment metagenome]
TSQAQSFGSTGIKADVIAESTGAAGVTISNNIAVGGAAIVSTQMVALGVTSATFSRQFAGTLTYTGSSERNVSGGEFSALHQGTHASSGTVIALTTRATADKSSGGSISEVVGGSFWVASSINQSTGVDAFFGVKIVAPLFLGDKPSESTGIQIANQGHASVTDVVALDIAPQTAGSGDTYNIRQAGSTGFNIFAADTRIGGTADPTASLDVTGNVFIDGDTAGDIQLTVQAATSQSTNIFVVEISSGADKFFVDSDGDTLMRGHIAMGASGTINASRVLSLVELKEKLCKYFSGKGLPCGTESFIL